MNFIEELAAKRQQLLDGLDANEGDINLRIFEDFYPEEAHFIYELLQNAEDAGAKEAFFELTPRACIFEHDGSRHFDKRDIRDITGIFNSSKKDNPDKIGKFGVGFKSVFVYTETPIVHSKDYSFRIVKLVLPQEVPRKTDLGEKTRFEFPFNNPKKNAREAYAEVKAGLEQLSETTLLFLKNLRHVRWQVGQQTGAVRREERSDVHVEIVTKLGNKQSSSTHWLRFMAPVQDVKQFTSPVQGVEHQNVAVAFELAFTAEQTSFAFGEAISKTLKIVPSTKGKVSVFFPAEKETSGLRFHLHAPFIPELSRASIKNSPENVPLFEQLAKLSARCLHTIKELGLLTGEFLAVLPNNDDVLPERYQALRTAIIDEMRAKPLTPTHARGFAPAKFLFQARAQMKELLSDADLGFVLNRSDKPTWAIGYTQRNNNVDRFLTSLGIQTFGEENLSELFQKRARETEYSWQGRIDPVVMNWLAGKSDEWLQLLYAVLFKYCNDEGSFSSLTEAKIVRLANGEFSIGSKAYFPIGRVDPTDPFPRVAEGILNAGSRKAQQADARKFLEEIDVRVPGEAEEISLILRTRYTDSGDAPDDRVYLADLKRFITHLEHNPQDIEMFSDAWLFRVDSETSDWAPASAVYLDAPFVKTGLSSFYSERHPEADERWPLSQWYLKCGVARDQLVRFAKVLGCETVFSQLYEDTNCYENPMWSYLAAVPGERYTSPINRDFALTDAAAAMLTGKNATFARLVWSTLCAHDGSVLKARYRKNASGGSRYADSRLVHQLSNLEWVPLQDGRFVSPRDATQDELLEGFAYDSGYKWLQLVAFGAREQLRSSETVARAAKRTELGFETEEELQRARALVKLLPPEEQARLIADYKSRKFAQEEEFPERPVRNRELRGKRVQEQGVQTPAKQSEVRSRSVPIGYEEAKAGAQAYLREQYTNANGTMFCQVCKAPLPFKLATGTYYFEAVELSNSLAKRYRETFLSMCPNHAAMFKYANEQRESMAELAASAAGLEIEVTLAGAPTTIQLTETHLADIQACIRAEAARTV